MVLAAAPHGRAIVGARPLKQHKRKRGKVTPGKGTATVMLKLHTYYFRTMARSSKHIGGIQRALPMRSRAMCTHGLPSASSSLYI